MKPLDSSTVETLLNMPESHLLDFKRDQYPLAGATNEQKGELVKDVITFANAWKTSDAYIFLGADENPGGKAVIVGLTGHLNDADLQQLVNNKTNVPVALEYIPLILEDKRAAVIRIQHEQQRPIFLKKKFGKLNANIVYIRRGSSTGEAAPDEVARMGTSAEAAQQIPVLDLELGEPNSQTLFGQNTTVSCRVLIERPPSPPLPRNVQQEKVLELLEPHFMKKWPTIKRPRDSWLVEPDPKQLAVYKKEMSLLQPLGFCVRNKGRVLVEDVRIILTVRKQDGLRVVDEPPSRPDSSMNFIPTSFAYNRAPSSHTTDVGDVGGSLEVVARLGKIQPGQTVWSKPFWIGSSVARDLELVARVYGDNIPAVMEVPIQLTIAVMEAVLDDEDKNDECD